MTAPAALRLGYVIFYVEDVTATLRFYADAFGLVEKFALDDYGELETGATTLSFVAHSLAHANLDAVGGFTPVSSSGPPTGASITLVAGDVTAATQRAIAAGARPYLEPTVKPWGQTVSYLLDPNGILIEIGTPVGS